MTAKGKCRHCGQVIQATTFDKCMYCGEPLPPDQRFAPGEKERIAARQADALEQHKTAHQAALKRLGCGSTGSDVGGGDIGGGDCGD